jgi:subtilisin family serine protease
VIDSGIDSAHPHFEGYHTLDDPTVRSLHRDFTNPANSTDPALAFVDDTGHGTHVAAIIAGGLELWSRRNKGGQAIATAPRYNAGSEDVEIAQPRDVPDLAKLAGMAPRAKLVSLKALGGGGEDGARISRVILALEYVRSVNASNEVPRIHGVNLSLGYGFDAQWFACGRSPLCIIVDQLVRSGVVVVVAAGNTGYVTLNPFLSKEVVQFSAATTINDPGNAERAITVGSTHRDAPHAYGVSYFSSRGPTGDGRTKPDLLAPGERILSAAGGPNLHQVLRAVTGVQPNGYPAGYAAYVEQTGTSMAAPHVSGAIAAFLSVKREFIGRPDEVKCVFVDSATSLNREPAWQGAGLVNLLRALQSV